MHKCNWFVFHNLMGIPTSLTNTWKWSKYYSYDYTKSYELWGIHFLRGIIIIMGLKHPVYGTTSTRNNEKKMKNSVEWFFYNKGNFLRPWNITRNNIYIRLFEYHTGSWKCDINSKCTNIKITYPKRCQN